MGGRGVVLVVSILVLLILVGTIVLVGQLNRRRTERLKLRARWEVNKYESGSYMVVAASRTVKDTREVLEEIVIDKVPKGHLQYSHRIAMAEVDAQVRVDQLNGDSLEGGSTT